MATPLTATQIYSIARQAGFPPETATKMTAIAIKESGGNASAYNGTGPDNSYGLWQINMIGGLGPARLAQFGLSDASQLLDPLTNAKAAYAIWAGNDANLNSAWAINRGVDQVRYQAALPTAQAAANSFGDPLDTSGAEPSMSPGGFLSSMLPSFSTTYPEGTISEAPAANEDNAMLWVGAGILGLVLFAYLSD